jgi:hypothetical protein
LIFGEVVMIVENRAALGRDKHEDMKVTKKGGGQVARDETRKIDSPAEAEPRKGNRKAGEAHE